MMIEIKKCLKLCKYGYQFKTNIITGLIFFVLGLIFLFTTSSGNTAIVVACVLVGPFMIVQVMYNMLFSNLLVSSSLHKAVDITFPNVVGIFISLFSFGMTFVGLLANPRMRTGTLADSGNVVIAAAISIAVVIIYCSMSFKCFVVGTLFFGLMYGGVFGSCEIFVERATTTDLLTGSIIGFLIVAAGNVLTCVLRAALYKKALSPFAGGAGLRKALK